MGLGEFLPKGRMGRQLAFIAEADKLKSILRQSLIMDGSRRENDAEHSWHVSAMAAILFEYADDSRVSLSRVIEMALFHDMVEIYAGDTFAYDAQGNESKREREAAAANRLFAILPDGQAGRFRALWQEFDEARTPDAVFALAMDRLSPLLANMATGGSTWAKRGVKRSQALERMAPIGQASQDLWKVAVGLLDEAVRMGYLLDG